MKDMFDVLEYGECYTFVTGKGETSGRICTLHFDACEVKTEHGRAWVFFSDVLAWRED